METVNSYLLCVKTIVSYNVTNEKYQFLAVLSLGF